MKVDWTRKKRPWLEDNVYKINYKTDIFSKDDDYRENLARNIREGVSALFEYYNKATFSVGQLQTIIDNNSDPEIYVDPRPRCGHFYLLLEVPEDVLESSPTARDFSIPEDALILNTNTVDFIEKTRDVAEMLSNYRKNIVSSGDSVFVEGYRINFDKSIEKIKNYPSALSRYFQENGEVYNASEPISMVIVFDNSYRLSGVIYDNSALLVGVQHFSGNSSFRNAFANRAVINIDGLHEVYRENSGRFVISDNSRVINAQWREILRFVPDVRVRKEKRKEDKAFHNKVGDRFLRRINPQRGFGAFTEDYWRRRYDLTKSSRISIGENCGQLTQQDIDTLFKTLEDKQVEEAIGSLAKDRVKVWEDTIDLRDFVGDKVFNLVTDPSYGPGSFDDIYKNVLNHISFDLLLKRVLECFEADIPGICAEIYFPFSLDFPDNLKIPDIFGSISDLIIRALLLAIQELIIAILETILGIIRDCQVDLKELGYGSADKEEYFKDNLDIASEDMARKIFENFDSVSEGLDAGNLPEGTISDFLGDLAAALTPQEMCFLVNGNPTEETLEIILCLLDINYPILFEQLNSKGRIVALFDSLSPFFDRSICEAPKNIPIPTGADVCQTDDRDALREALLADSGLSKREIDEQLEKARNRRKSEIDFVKDLFDQGNRQDLLNKGKSPEQFARELSPCAAENENMRHMIEITVNSSIRSIEKMYKDALIGPSGLKKEIASTENIQDLVLDYQAPSVIETEGDNYRILHGRNSVSYSQRNGSQTHIINTRVANYVNVPELPSVLPSYGSNVNWRHEALNTQLNKFVNTKRTMATNGAMVGIGSTSQDISDSAIASALDPSAAPVSAAQVSQVITTIQRASQDVRDDYKATFKDVFRDVAKIVSTTNMMGLSAGTIENRIDDTVSPNSDPTALFDNCWLPLGESVRKKIVDTYFELECEDRDSSTLSEAMVTGLIYLYVRSAAIEYIFQNFPIITDFHSEALSKSFAREYLKNKVMPIMRYFSDSRFITSADEIVDGQIDTVMEEVWSAFDDHIDDKVTPDRKNIYRYYLNNLTTVEDESGVTMQNLNKKFYLYYQDNSNEYSLSLRHIINRDGKNEAITLSKVFIKKPAFGPQLFGLKESFKEAMINDEDFLLLFDFIFPLNDILSMLTIYNTLKFQTKAFERLYKTIEFTLEALVNVDDFKFKPESMTDYNDRSSTRSQKSDPRPSVARDISLPWLSTEVLRIVI